MQVSDHLIDLLEEMLVSGLKLGLGDANRFKKKFRKNPGHFLVSLILSAKKDALDKWGSVTTGFTLWHTVGDQNLQEARKLIEEWGESQR